MPLSSKVLTTEGDAYASPFVGPVHYTAQIPVDVSGLTDDEVDANGYLKPGVPLKKDGTLVGAGESPFGFTIEPIKIADDNVAGTLAAADDLEVAVATICQVNQDVVEDILGRALTADELAVPGYIVIL